MATINDYITPNIPATLWSGITGFFQGGNSNSNNNNNTSQQSATASPTAYSGINDYSGYTYVNQPTTDQAKQAQAAANKQLLSGSSTGGSNTPPTTKTTTTTASSSGPTWTGQGDKPVGWNGETANTNIDNEISDMYKNYIGLFDQIAQNSRDQSAQDEASIGRQYNEGINKAKAEGTELYQDLNNNVDKFNETYRSAVADALRAFQGLQQQKASRYGGGSSVGAALGELANTEFLRNQGNLLSQRATGEKEFQLEGTRLKRYVDEKISSWDSWKADAIDKIRTQLRSSLNEIALRKGDAEMNKTKDRIALLQDAVNRARQVQDMDTQFRQNIATYAVEKAGELNQNNFSLASIPGIVNKLMGYNILGSNTGSATNTATAAAKTGSRYDEYGNLIQA